MDPLSKMLSESQIEQTTVTKRTVITCNECGAQFTIRHDALRHAFQVHIPPVERRDVGERALFYFVSEDQMTAWRTSHAYWTALHWDGPGWYTEALKPERDVDGDEVEAMYSLNHVRTEIKDEIKRLNDELTALRDL